MSPSTLNFTDVFNKCFLVLYYIFEETEITNYVLEAFEMDKPLRTFQMNMIE